MEAEALGLSGDAQDDNELLWCRDFLAKLAKSDLSADKMRKLARNEHDHLSSVVAKRASHVVQAIGVIGGGV